MIELMFPADISAPRAARAAVTDLSGRLRPKVVDDVRLLVTELVTNSVRHAGLDAASSITVRVGFKAACVRVEVIDPGRGFERPTERREVPSGWGLFLVGEIADRWGVEHHDATSVWFELDDAEHAPRTSTRA